MCFFPVCAFVISVCTGPAFAENEEQIRRELYSVFETVRTLSIPLSAAGIAGSAVRMITGNSSEASAAVRRIVVILSAAAALWLIPAAISSGAGLFSGFAWTPGG